jgi:hypothetical protein
VRELFDGAGLTKIVPENSDTDVPGKREIGPWALQSEVPPLKGSRGRPDSSPLNSTPIDAHKADQKDRQAQSGVLTVFSIGSTRGPSKTVRTTVKSSSCGAQAPASGNYLLQ